MGREIGAGGGGPVAFFLSFCAEQDGETQMCAAFLTSCSPLRCPLGGLFPFPTSPTPVVQVSQDRVGGTLGVQVLHRGKRVIGCPLCACSPLTPCQRGVVIIFSLLMSEQRH